MGQVSHLVVNEFKQYFHFTRGSHSSTLPTKISLSTVPWSSMSDSAHPGSHSLHLHAVDPCIPTSSHRTTLSDNTNIHHIGIRWQQHGLQLARSTWGARGGWPPRWGVNVVQVWNEVVLTYEAASYTGSVISNNLWEDYSGPYSLGSIHIISDRSNDCT